MTLTDALQITGLSHAGQVRERNEDSIEIRPELGLVILADGMGGHTGGAVASRMATSSLAAGLEAQWTPAALSGLDRKAAMSLSQTIVQEQVRQANNAVYDAARKNPDYAEMGTTLVACLFYDNFVTVAHLGDSRLYRLRDDVLEQITRDHSLLQQQIDAGMFTAEEAHLSANKNFLTRALGINYDEEAEIHSYDVQEGDLFLLCSDGLHGMLARDDIEMTLSLLKANLALTAQQLIEAANDAGGNDNVSVILLQVVKDFAA